MRRLDLILADVVSSLGIDMEESAGGAGEGASPHSCAAQGGRVATAMGNDRQKDDAAPESRRKPAQRTTLRLVWSQ